MVDSTPRTWDDAELQRLAALAEDEPAELVRKWTQSTRYMNVMMALSERDAREEQQQTLAESLAKKRIRKKRRDALFTAGLALLVLLGAALFAGLL
jgi:hypothetical protein